MNITNEMNLAKTSAASNTNIISTEQSRKTAEVQAAMTVAKKFPRDQNISFRNIIESCKRKTLAEKATYAYPRGGGMVVGPSIRLAEVLAQQWGNIDFGLLELDRSNGESSVMAYCWDLETNTRRTTVFQVRHIRDTRQGPKKLTDERDIYELVANMGARRMRACILNVIPADITEEALKQCALTLSTGIEPIADRCRKMVNAFTSISVSVEMLEEYLSYKLSAIDEEGLNQLRSIYTSIKDGETTRDSYFSVTSLPAKEVSKEDDDNVVFEAEPIKPKRTRKKKKSVSEEFKKVIQGHEAAVEAYALESEWIKAGEGIGNLKEAYMQSVLSQPQAFLKSIS